MGKTWQLMTIVLLFAIPAVGQESPSKELHWPDFSAIQGYQFNESTSGLLGKSPKVYVQSDFHGSLKILPDWFTAQFKLVVDAEDADFFLFVRCGAGGTVNPDILLETRDGTHLIEYVAERTPPAGEPALESGYDFCDLWPHSENASCLFEHPVDLMLQQREQVRAEREAQAHAQKPHNSWDWLATCIRRADMKQVYPHTTRDTVGTLNSSVMMAKDCMEVKSAACQAEFPETEKEKPAQRR